MALVIKDRVKEATTSTGTGSITLTGAESGFQAFSAIGDGNTTYYAIVDSANAAWEVGLGTYTLSGTTLSRDTVLESSNSGSKVDFAAGDKIVFSTYPAEKAVYADGSGLTTLPDGLVVAGDLTVQGTTTTIEATNLAVADNMIYLRDGETTGNVDLGFAGNYNDGTYAHAGFFRDATDGRWKIFDGYTPEPDAATDINTAHASFALADFQASNLYGNLTGNVTGNVTGNLTGNVTGDASGNAGTATKLSTSRSIGLSGDASGSALFDGSANATISVTIADDSHNHVISNVDGLQAALDAKQAAATAVTTTTSFGGDVSGTYDAIVVADDSHNHIISNVDGLQTALDGKQPLSTVLTNTTASFTTADESKLDGIESGATADQTASEILTAIKTVDGSGSGLDADTLDGQEGSYYYPASNPNGYITSYVNTTYSAGSGLDLSGTTFSIESDLRDNVQYVGRDSNDYIYQDGSNIRFYINGAEDWRMVAGGTFHADGDVIAYSSTISDVRLKENIVGIDGALSKVSQLNGYTFTYKADGKVSAGVIAQEVEKVLPEAVSEKELPLKADDGKEYKVVNYDALHGLLIEAIKELKAEIAELKAKVG